MRVMPASGLWATCGSKGRGQDERQAGWWVQAQLATGVGLLAATCTAASTAARALVHILRHLATSSRRALLPNGAVAGAGSAPHCTN